MTLPSIVSREEWLLARKRLLAEEKAATQARDALNARRRELPMVRIDKDYVFETAAGKANLRELFEGLRQLVIYHFMFHCERGEGCPGCSHFADNIGHLAHLRARNTSLALVSRAPLAEIEPFRKRMGWTIPWHSSWGSDFNYDFHVTTDAVVEPVEYNYRDQAALEKLGQSYHVQGEQPGLSVFLREGGQVFHSYSSYGRGLDLFLNTYNFLDLTPLGRQEENSKGGPSWLRYHDKYEQ